VIASVSVEAERELVDAAVFYAGQANAELGLALIAEFERSLGVLCNHPHLGPVWRGSTRRIPLRRFPYSIIYQVKPEEARVIALAHQNRRPGYWRGRK
jgi:plasmid stabilization system protein ParE